MNAVELTDLTKHYGDFTLDRVSLTLPEGCVMGYGPGCTVMVRVAGIVDNPVVINVRP